MSDPESPDTLFYLIYSRFALLAMLLLIFYKFENNFNNIYQLLFYYFLIYSNEGIYYCVKI